MALAGLSLMAIASTRLVAEETSPASSKSDKAYEESAAGNHKEESPALNRIASFGNLVTLGPGETAPEIVVVGASADIHGTIEKEVFVMGGTVHLGSEARVGTNLVVIGGDVIAAPGARVGDNLAILGGRLEAESLALLVGGRTLLVQVPPLFGWTPAWVARGLAWGRPVPMEVFGVAVLAGLFMLSAIAVAGLFPGTTVRLRETAENGPLIAFFVGLLALVLAGPLFILLAVSVVGIVLIPFLVCGLAVSIFLGRMAVHGALGHRLAVAVALPWLSAPIPSVLAGTVILVAVYNLPLLGILVWGVTTPIGLGAALLAAARHLASRPVDDLVIPGELPAVGFWPRLGATLLDLLLVAGVLAIFRWPQGFVPVWILYHGILWSWKSTTVGGLALGLRIVRIDGKPMSAALATVRCLCAFLSFAAFFVGFFWAAWDARRQSWHDKITGTVIVRQSRPFSFVEAPTVPSADSNP
jgi:uncharacterized RDD family membrane protein YckC